MLIAAEFGTGQVFWSMLWFFLFFIWIWLLIGVFADIFRSDDLSGWLKALWIVVIIVLPYLGVLVYLIARGGKMRQREVHDAQQADVAMRQYIRETAGSTQSGPADEIARLADLRDRGVIDEAEFQSAKAKLLT
jgi:Short C-terminal domain/Phospholipase_D-nuclease N-terminal